MDIFSEADRERLSKTVFCTAELQGIFSKALRSGAKCDCGSKSCFTLVRELPERLISARDSVSYSGAQNFKDYCGYENLSRLENDIHRFELFVKFYELIEIELFF